MDENQRSKTVKRVKTVACITLSALIGFGAGWYLPQITNKAKLNSNKSVIDYDIRKNNYGWALEDYDHLIEFMVHASKDTKTKLLSLKEKIQEINPLKLMKEADSITTRVCPDFLVEHYNRNIDPDAIYSTGVNLRKKLNLYFRAKEGFESLGVPIDFLESKIVSTYLNLLLAETINSNENKHKSSHADLSALGYQSNLYSYLEGMGSTNNLRIKEKELSAFLNASVLLVNNALTKFPEEEEDASKWLDYLEKTNEISKLFGVSEQDRKEKLDPMKELISEYCNKKVDNVNLD